MVKTLSWLSAVAFLLAIAADSFGAEASGGHGSLAVLHLSDGDYLAGSLQDCDQAGTLRWQCPAFVAPLDFPLSAVSAVSLPTPAERPKPSGQHCFELQGGDVLFGELVGLSAQDASLDVSGLGIVRVQRSALRRIVRWRGGGDLVYVGPNGLSEWKEASPAGAWEQEGGQVFATRAGATLFGDLSLPARACIEVELSWTSEPDFVLAMGTSREQGDRAFRLEVARRHLLLLRETEDKADLARLQEIASGAGRCHLQVYLDQERGRAIVLGSDGKLLADVTLSDGHSRPQPGIRLTHYRGGVRLEQLRIARWDGQAPREVQAAKSRIHRSDGSAVYGEVRGFNAAAKEFVVAQDGRETRVRADAVDSVVLPGPDGPPPQEIRAALRDGTRLGGRLRKVEKGRLWLDCPGVVEPVGLRVADLQMLAVLVHRKPPDVRSLVAKVHGTQQSRPAGIARLEADNMRLHGALVDGKEQAGASCLVWRPTASPTASALKPEVSARIVYRDPPALKPSSALAQARAARRVAVMAPAVQGNAIAVEERAGLMPYLPSSVRVRRSPALYLRTGDTIACTIKRIDERGITFEAPESKVTFIAHDKIKAVDLEYASLATKIDPTKRDRLLTLPRMQRDDPPTHLIRSTEGDYLRGRLIAMDDKTLTVEVREETRRLPRERIARIIWLSAAPAGLTGKESPTVTPPNVTRVQVLRDDGIRLTLLGESVGNKTLQGTSEVLGACRVDLDKADQLIVGGAIEQAVADLPYQRWKLSRAADPKFVSSDGKQGDGLPGTLSALVGKPAPEFEVETLDSKRFRLSDHRGKIVVLDFFASWCGPCVQTLPQIVRAVEKHQDRNVILLAVNLQETPKAITAMLTRLAVKANVGLDRDGVVAEKYAAIAIPQTVIIDAQGNVARLFIGDGQAYVDQVREALEAIVAPAPGRGTSP